MCFIVAAFITIGHPLRHPLQMIVCVGQIYGLILYYGTSMFDHYYNEIAYSRPEPWYFWGYYFFTNFIWMVFPSCASPVLCIAVTQNHYIQRG
jgi:cholestenol delta-isomerase